ncbi:MAG: hypothetical protein U0T69_11025 [Chitinophagales bacterium]
METNCKDMKTYYVIYKGTKVGIFYGKIKYLELITKKYCKSFPTEHEAMMYWHRHSNEIPPISDVIDNPTSSNDYIIVKRIDGPGLW